MKHFFEMDLPESVPDPITKPDSMINTQLKLIIELTYIKADNESI